MSDTMANSDATTNPVRASEDRTLAPGQIIGSAIAGIFGLVYVELNAGPLPEPWSAVLRIAAAAAAAGLAILLMRLARSQATADDEDRADPDARAGFGRRYWIIVAVEVAAIWAGSAVLSGPAGLPRAVIAWVSIVVGTHFLALAALWRLRMLRFLGIAMTMCGLAGLVAAIADASPAVIAAAGGVLPGILLLVAGYRGATGRVS